MVKSSAIKWFSPKACRHLTPFTEWSAAACTPAGTYRWAVLWWDWAKGSPPWSWRCTCHCHSSRSGTCHSGSVGGGWSPRSGPRGNSGGRPGESSNLSDSSHDQHHWVWYHPLFIRKLLDFNICSIALKRSTFETFTDWIFFELLYYRT